MPAEAAGGAALAPPGRPVHRRRTTCRACGAARLRPFLALGPQPLANAFLRGPDAFADEARYPLDLCLCEGCALVQLADVIDPEVLFRDYIYVTGISETIATHNKAYARTVADLLGLTTADLVVELASNDGSLLACFRDLGVRTLGVEPATNIAAIARGHGLETLNEFFDAELGVRIRETHGPARAVIGNNVLAHVDDTQGFLRGAARLLAPDGLVIAEVPYAGEMLDRLEYDTVYHEHLCYFSVSALLRVCEAVGLVAVRIDRVPVHGGSLRLYAGLAGHYRAHAADVRALAEAERARDGVASPARWERFARDVAAQKGALLALLRRLKGEGKTLAGYGAPAKGNTLLNYCGIGPDLLPYTVDRSPWKVGTFTPGTHIPVLPAETLIERRPDYAMILAWNLADEIVRQQQEYRRRGGRFILPLPEPVVLA